MLAEMGAHVIDADALSKACTAPGGAAMPAVREAFGPAVIGADGGLDRTHMRDLAFKDPSVRQRLQAIVHPLVRAAVEQALTEASGRWVVLDIPLLAESPEWREKVDAIWVVDCSEETQVRRVSERNGWTPDTVRAVIGAQASRTTRRAIADVVLLNEGKTLAELREEIRDTVRDWAPRFGL